MSHARPDRTVRPTRTAPARHRPVVALVAAVLVTLATRPAAGQNFVGGIPLFSEAPGVILDPNGSVRERETDERKHLAAVRARAKAAADAAKDERLAYVSLPRLFAQVRAHLAEGKPMKDLPEDVRFLGGLTQVRYVLVYPEEQDLVIAGPAEPWHVADDGANGGMVHVIGRKSGRPVMQLDDLVVAMRTMWQQGAGQFGCGIWPQPDSLEKAKTVATQLARASRQQRVQALRDALGPQEVKIFGTQPDTRLAFVCVAADYKLKRIGLGMESVANSPIGHAMDDTRSAASMVWFKLAYEPLLVSPDANAYQFRGPRLRVGTGQFDFDARGATEKAKQFAKKFSDAMPAMCVGEPLFAELQNVADLGMLATLIRADSLDRKAGWDTGWILSDGTLPVATMPVPRTADTCVASVSGSLVCGGVVMTPASYVVGPQARAKDEGKALDAPKKQLTALRAATAKDQKAAIFVDTATAPKPAGGTATTQPSAAPAARR